MVRINQLPMGLEDLAEIVPESPDLVLLPKVERPEHVAETDRMIGELKSRYGITRPIWLMPILESALGIENASAIATASKNVVALTIGLEDYTADMGVAKTAEGSESLYARMRLVNAAKAVGVQAIDSVFGDVGDMASLRSWAENSRALGFEGMGCIHPAQIPVIHEAFAPSAGEIEKATKIVAAFEEAQQRGLGVVSLGSKMIDPPVVERAQRLVERAKRMGKGVESPAEFILAKLGLPIPRMQRRVASPCKVKGGGQACPERTRRECPPHTGQNLVSRGQRVALIRLAQESHHFIEASNLER